ncbi:hypothetical protein M5689_022060 [Euphorbia peplus]|nr:hypothetical protein M5689_022060 [Euphorbia peplus]
MEEIGAFWTYHESLEDVKQKLLYTTMELQRLKMESQEQTRRHREDVKQLIELINISNKQRDDLQNILNKLISCNSPQSPLFVPIKSNSTITESSSLNSSPVDSFFDAVSSPDSSNTQISPSFTRVSPTFTRVSPNYTEFHPVGNVKMDPIDSIVNGERLSEKGKLLEAVSPSFTRVSPTFTSVSPTFNDFHPVKMDPIDSIVKGKRLPEKGKLLEAVTEAGPLLQTLLVAGPLPRWRNPPPLQTFKIPPVSIKGCEAAGNNSGDRKHPSYGGSSSSSVSSITKRQRLRC